MSNFQRVTPVCVLIILINTGCFQNNIKDTVDLIWKQKIWDEKSESLAEKKKLKYTVYSGKLLNESGIYREYGPNAKEMENARTYTVKVMPDLSSASINGGPLTNLVHDKDNVYLFTQGAMMGSGISVTPNNVTILNYDGSEFGIVYKTEDIYE